MIIFPDHFFRCTIVVVFTSTFLALPIFSKDKITEINETTKNHWSHLPLKSPLVPTVENPNWVKNPIDSFVLSKLTKNGLTPNPEADKAELARRAYLNLTGLAPTPEQVSKLRKSSKNFTRYRRLAFSSMFAES